MAQTLFCTQDTVDTSSYKVLCRSFCSVRCAKIPASILNRYIDAMFCSRYNSQVPGPHTVKLLEWCRKCQAVVFIFLLNDNFMSPAYLKLLIVWFLIRSVLTYLLQLFWFAPAEYVAKGIAVILGWSIVEILIKFIMNKPGKRHLDFRICLLSFQGSQSVRRICYD